MLGYAGGFLRGLFNVAGPMSTARGTAAMGAGAAARSFAGTRTGMGMLGGMVTGGAWGMMSDDTSVLGGAMMGAGIGAVGGRYGGAGLRRAALGRRGIGVGGERTITGMTGAAIGFGKGVRNAAMADYRSMNRFSINLMSNTATGAGIATGAGAARAASSVGNCAVMSNCTGNVIKGLRQ